MEDWQYQKIMERLDDMERAQRRANARIRAEVAGVLIGILVLVGIWWFHQQSWNETWWAWLVFFGGYIALMAWLAYVTERIEKAEGVDGS